MRLAAGWQGREKEVSGEMCGVFCGETRMPARRVVSYVEGTSSAACPLGRSRFRGHEFHYSEVCLAPGTAYAYQLSRGTGIKDNLDGAVVKNTLGSYTHLHPVASRDMQASTTSSCSSRRFRVAITAWSAVGGGIWSRDERMPSAPMIE